jgi:hypothetical protein
VGQAKKLDNLVVAARDGDLERVKVLIKEGQKIDMVYIFFPSIRFRIPPLHSSYQQLGGSYWPNTIGCCDIKRQS